MQTMAWSEIEEAGRDDVGRVALMNLGGRTLAIEATLEACLETWNRVSGEQVTAADVDIHTDRVYLTTGTLVAVEVGEDD